MMTAAQPPTAEPAPTFAPRRSTDDRVLLGLLGGLAPNTGRSSTTLRLIVLAVGTVLAPLMLLAYTVTALILPADDGSVLLGNGERRRRDVLWAVLLSILAACSVLDGSLTSGWGFFVLAPFAVIAGAALLWRDSTNRPAATWTAPASAFAPASHAGEPPAGQAAQQPAAATTTADVQDATDAAVDGPPTLIKDGPPAPVDEPPADVPAGGGDGGGDGAQPPTGQPPQEPSFVPPEQRRKVRRRTLALPVVAAMALIPAVATLLSVAGVINGTDQTVSIVLALMALVATVGAVAVAVLRPSYLGAVGLLLIAALTGTMSIVTNQFGDLASDGLGERNYHPANVRDLRQPFVLGAGELTIDLRDLPLQPRERVDVDAQLGFGELNVIVPEGTRVRAADGADAQSISVSARDNGATNAESSAAPTIVLDAQLRGGNVRVLTGKGERQEQMDVLAEQSVGFWSADQDRRNR